MVHPSYFTHVCLASKSPRRRELLDQLGVAHEVFPADIDESKRLSESSESYVKRITEAKANAIWNHPQYQANWPVLASDTAVVIDQKVLGKPATDEDADFMLQLLSGREHSVMTGVCVRFQSRIEYLLSHSRVHFRTLSDADRADYLATREGVDKAGGYAVQGYAASLIEHIQGSYSGIMGLPLFETSQLLDRFNIAYWKHAQHE